MSSIDARSSPTPVDPPGPVSSFDHVVSARTLNMVALATSVLWLLAMLSSLTRVPDEIDDPAVWDYVAATNESTGFLVVTVVAWVGAAIVGSIRRR